MLAACYGPVYNPQGGGRGGGSGIVVMGVRNVVVKNFGEDFFEDWQKL